MMKSLREKRKDFACSYYTRFILPLDVKAPENKDQFGENLIKLNGARCKSYWSSKTTITCEPDRLCEDQSMELPRINYQYNGKEYRYAYAVCMGEGFAETLKVNRYFEQMSALKTEDANFVRINR
jgi:Retinal pigment epithelial membrane protein